MEKVIIKIGDSEFEVKLTKEQIEKIEESGKYDMKLFDSEEFKKMVDEIYDVQNQEKTVAYMTKFQKDVLEKYFNIKFESDDCIYQTPYGRYRFISFIDNSYLDLSLCQSEIYVIDGIYESEDK